MSLILYAGFEDKLKDTIVDFKQSEAGSVIFKNYSDLLHSMPERELKTADLFLIGPSVSDPLGAAQKVYAADKLLSVLIVSNKEHLKQLNEAIRYAPFIGSTLRSISWTSGRELYNEISEAVEKTIRRRHFKTIVGRSAAIKPSVPRVEGVKWQFRDIFLDHAPVGAVLAYSDGNIIMVNRRMKSLFHNQDWGNVFFHQLFPAALHDDIRAYISSPVSDDEEQKIIELTRSGDRNVFFEIKKTFFTLETGENRFLIIIVIDVTDKTLYELDLKEAIHQLAVRNEELENFTHIISHDLKNPLISLQALIDRCRTETDAVRQEKLLDMMKASVGKITDIHTELEELLEIQQNENLPVKRLRFKDEFDVAKEDLKELWRRRKTRFTEDFRKSDVRYIKPYLKSIILNLLSNALKYSSVERPVEIAIKTYPEEGFVVLSVADNGIGINLRKHQHKIFQPYYRLTAQAPGKGIGLSMVKRMVEKNGGFIHVRSELGKGSEFLCYLKEY